ncbi:universal stress protein [Nocardioides rubriscoriae]|uniref:universal stress protein n=1 Tax=Nocardioides rubriscoriae TaxID=642762 RepID=UPI001478CBBF|nr:universal stress protein [Nocardioides rubriscoriae]
MSTLGPRERPRHVVAEAWGPWRTRHAVRWACAQAVLERRPLTLAYTLAPWQVRPGLARLTLAAVGRAQARARRSARRTAPGVEVHTEVRVGHHPSVLVDLVAHEHLLVLVGPGRRRPGTGPGIRAVAIASGAGVPVVLVRRGDTSRARARVAVAVDGRPGSVAACEVGYAQAELRGSTLDVLGCLPAPAHRAGLPPSDADLATARDGLSRLTALHAAPARAHPHVAVDTAVVIGPVRDVLAQASPPGGLLVLSASRRGPSVRTSESLTAAVLRRSHCAVAVVPDL